MARALTWLMALFGVVCCVIALVHIAFGPASIPGSVPVNATMDSEDRFYATLFLGFGLAMVWASRDLAARSRLFFAMLAVFFAGGVARIISALMVGPPSALFIALGALELAMPPILYGWHRTAYR